MAALGSCRHRARSAAPATTNGVLVATLQLAPAACNASSRTEEGNENQSWQWRRRRQGRPPNLSAWPLLITLIATVAIAGARGQHLDDSIRQGLEVSARGQLDRPTMATTAATTPTPATTTTDASNQIDDIFVPHEDKSLPPSWPADHRQPESGHERHKHQHDHQQVLERRIDWLEFELRKSMHQMRQAAILRPDSQATADEQQQQSSGGAQWVAAFSERLELIEKYVAFASAKLYETEQQVKRLARCECRLSCKWSPPAGLAADKTAAALDQAAATAPTEDEQEFMPSMATTSADREAAGGQSNKRGRLERRLADQSNTTITWLLKADGQVWQSKCHVCSCHRGRVRCRYMSCPEPKCEEPHHLAGECCPVCYKPCVYKRQTVRHGNKLVMNSGQDTCKECMCIDGRFKCQRVEVERSAPRLTPATEANESDASLPIRRQRATPVELRVGVADSSSENAFLNFDDQDEDYADAGAEAEATARANNDEQSSRSRRRRHQHHASSTRAAQQLLPPLLVCPQIDCQPEEQVRLENDCCTYCKNFDFCALKSWHQCHPDALCISNLSAAIAAASAAGAASRNGEPQLLAQLGPSRPFSCYCKAGFVGDGRHCRDIDECSSRKLNACDTKTSVCVNLAGGYECRCKRGFKLHSPAGASRTQAQAADPGEGGANSSWQQQLVRRGTLSGEWLQRLPSQAQCADVNECADSKLNRCHPRAKCINLQGSYKCQCERGYLGDGFECHKWFSSDPDVAAYLHRHAEDRVAATGEHWSPSSQSNANLQPLGDDEESDKTGTTRLRPASFEGVPTADDDDDRPAKSSEDLEEVDEDEQQRDEAKPPKLSESRWEPLRFEGSSASLKQQPDSFQLAQNGTLGTAAVNSQASNNASSVERHQASEPHLNTRTMLFQPPSLFPRPRWWEQEQAQPQQQSQAANASAKASLLWSPSSSFGLVGGGGQTANHNSNARQSMDANTSQIVSYGRIDSGETIYDKSDTNDPVYIQRSSKTVYQPFEQKQTTLTSLVSNNNGNPSQATASSQPPLVSITVTNSTSANNNSTPGFRRATIIASATPTRGHGHRAAPSSSARYSKSRALGVTASSAGPQQQSSIRTFSRSYLRPLILINSLIHFYCIDLNHVVTFYFI